MWALSLDQEDSLQEELATHSTVLAWKIPWTEEPGGLQSTGSQRVGHSWALHSMDLTKFHLRENEARAPFFFFFNSVCFLVLKPSLIHFLFQFSSVAQSCLTLCDPMNRSTPGLPVHYQLLESTPTHVHWVIQWCHPTISSSVIPFSSCPKSFPASGSFPMSQLFASGGQSIGVSASISVLPILFM